MVAMQVDDVGLWFSVQVEVHQAARFPDKQHFLSSAAFLHLYFSY